MCQGTEELNRQRETFVERHELEQLQDHREEMLLTQPQHMEEHRGEELPVQPVQQQRQTNKGLKGSPTPEEAEEKMRRAKEKKRRDALKRDAQTVRNDKLRHGFYSAVKAVVGFWKWLTGGNKQNDAVKENTVYTQSLQIAYDEMLAKKLEAEENGTLETFMAEHGSYMRELERQYIELTNRVEEENEDLTEEEKERILAKRMQQEQTPMYFGSQEQAKVTGGTKPVSVQYGENGSKWLVKEAVSCIGINEPNSAIITETGYHIQKLVNPDTAIEAFRGQSIGKGIVSYQRMVQGVKKDDVDLFRFSRTPESMTEQEMARIQQLSPQILREHTTDWLLCNFDTKGENFIIANDGTGEDRVYGIDKEASFRAILDSGAQHMSKDYQKFDQNTVYNRLFQQFAAGTMELDLFAVQQQVERVEAMSNEDYMAMYKTYLSQQERTRPDKVPEIRARILRRKTGLRAEYRRFFSDLIEERCSHVSEDEAKALRAKYCGGEDRSGFVFKNESRETWEQDRQRQLQEEQEANKTELEKKAREADAKDERSYNRRHRLYDFSKAIVTKTRDIVNSFKQQKEEQRTVIIDGNQIDMRNRHEVRLGGTKPMSEYYGTDGSRWLSKQAVNCMGYYKLEGALLTEGGANLQRLIDPVTAVPAFVGRTKSEGDVSFQQRLENVEQGPDKLDLFKFSRHPEIATPEVIRQVQELGPQILREHTTDWLLCNFDTKGENFVITMDQSRRVLHGIDKEAAFSKILDPEAQQMSTTYKPHANNTLYNVVYTMYENNEMSLNLFDVLPQIRKVEAMDPQEYLGLYAKYLDHLEQKDPEKASAVKAQILSRKQNLRQDYCDFFTKLVLKRCQKVHPDEANELKLQYFGAGGMRFRFP